MACSLNTLTSSCDTWLQSASYRDYCHNGCQIDAGHAHIERILTSPTASLAACEAAVARGAQALIVHHGIIWGSLKRIDGAIGRRIRTLITGGCSLLAYHLPLDAQPQWGNNALALERLEARIDPQSHLPDRDGQAIGLVGMLEQPVDAETLRARCEAAFAHAVIHCPGSPRQIQRIGVVTGGGQNFLAAAAQAGCDALITGETSEQTWHEAAELDCHCFACGHYATECHAVHHLGRLLAHEHELEHQSFDEDNPL